MDTKPYNEWVNLYNKDIEHIWYSHHVELRKAAMLMKVLDNEFKRIQKNIQQNFMLCEQKVLNMEKKGIYGIDENSSDDKENKPNNKNYVDISSPEIFLCSGTPVLHVLNCSQDADAEDATLTSQKSNMDSNSPKINRFCKLPKLKKMKQCNISNYTSLAINQTPPKKQQEVHDVIDSTVIETTPEISIAQKKLKHSRNPDKVTKKGKLKLAVNNSTLTQMFSDISSSTKKDNSNSDATYCTDDVEMTSPINICYDKDNNAKRLEELKQRNFVFKEPTVRGKARLKVEGWDCAECQEYYNKLGLNTEDTKKLLNKCSKHRSKFKPHDFTPKGFWDLRFPPTQSPEMNSGHSTYFQY